MAYEKSMPRMLEDRDYEIAAMQEEEIRQAGIWLFGERPDLDVEMIFELENPYEPTLRLAERLRQQYGLWWTQTDRGDSLTDVRYLIRFDWMGAVQDLSVQGCHARWLCPVLVERFDGHLSGPEPDTVFETTGVWESRVAYPVTEAPEPQSASLAEWAAAGGWLPAGPEGGGADAIGKVLAEYNALREVELWADRALGSRRVG